MRVTMAMTIRRWPKGMARWDGGAIRQDFKFYFPKACAPAMELYRRELLRPTRTWQHAVDAEISYYLDGETMVAAVIIKDQIYNWLNEGTKPHVIRAKNAPYLRFRVGGFIAKTRPGSLFSGPGSPATGPMVSKKQVWHPGTEPRKWTEKAKEFTGAKVMLTGDLQEMLVRIFKGK